MLRTTKGVQLKEAVLVILILVLLPICSSAQKLSGKAADYKGRPVFFVNDEPIYPMIYAITEGGRFTWEESPSRHIRQFGEIGVRIIQIDTWFRDIWREDDTLDMDFVNKQIGAVKAVHPDAAINIRLHLDPPGWWYEKYPEEVVAYADGPIDSGNEIGRVKRQSMPSPRWRREGTERLSEFCMTLSSSPEGDCVVAIHPTGGVYGEWHYWGFFHEPDTSQCMTDHFRSWLRAKYGTDEALRSAWNNVEATFEAATVPDLQERLHTSDGVFRDPRKEQKLIDYYICHQSIVADSVIHFCRSAKEFWPRPIITGVFYGYYFYMYKQATGGHLEMDRILKSPYVDYLSAPFAYEGYQRVCGGSGQLRQLVDTIRMNGKVALDEYDQGTHLGDVFGRKPPYTPGTIAESIANFRRNAGQVLAKGVGMWWYDFGPTGNSGWWDHPDYLADIGKLRDLAESLKEKHFEPAADVLFVYDTRVFYHLGLPDQDIDPISPRIDEMSDDAYHSGAAFDAIHIMDVEKADIQRYRVVVLVNTFLLSDDQRRFITDTIRKGGRTVVFIYAPGYTDGRTLDTGRMSDLVGMELQRADMSGRPSIVVNSASEWTPKSGLLSTISTRFGIGAPVRPLFAVTDSSAKAVGHYEGTDQVALARKDLGDCTVWYCGLMLRNANLMREIFRSAGAHIYNEANDVTFAGSGLLVVHTKDGGRRMLALRNGSSLEVDLPEGSTTFFDIETGRKILE